MERCVRQFAWARTVAFLRIGVTYKFQSERNEIIEKEGLKY